MTTSPVVTITEEMVAEIQAELEKATPGPWTAEDSPVGEIYISGGCDEFICGAIDHVHDANLIALMSPEVLRALLAERAAMQSQIKAGIATQDNLELYRKDALRYQWLSKRISVSQYHVLGAELSSNTVEGVGEAIDQAMQEQQP